ncbi:hypothetical protein BsWGS_17238 [Bradybaena similaris]
MMCLLLMTMLLMTACVSGQATQSCTDCHTKECVSVGYAALNGVDKRVNPCDNFFKYACGGWMERQFLTTDRHTIKFTDTIEPLGATIKLLSQGFKDGDPDAVKKAKNLFKSCQNYVHGYGNTISKTVTELFGSWPIGCLDCDISSYNLERSLIETTRLGAHPLFTLSARVNHLDYNAGAKTFNRYLHVGEPTLRLPLDENSYSLDDSFVEKNYIDVVIETARNFVFIENEVAARLHARNIFKVEQAIAEKVHRIADGTIKSSLGSLNEDYGQLMNWTSYINKLAPIRDTDLGEITLNETIFVKSPTTLTSIIKYFIQLPKGTQVNYLAWRLVDTLHNAIVKPEDMEGAFLRYRVPEDHDVAYRDEGCALFVTQTLPLAVDRLLYAEYLPPHTVQKVNSMFQQIKYEFHALIASNNWLDHNDKRFIKEKIDSITAVVANYFEAMDDEFLDSYYSNVTINSTHEIIERDFPHQVVMVKGEAFISNFWSIKLPAKVDFEEPPQVYSAQLITQINEIVLSFAAVFHPWFVDQAPMVVNYAGAMHTLAHQLVNYVSSEGMRFNKYGTEGTRIGQATKEAFDERTICFRLQYLGYASASAYERIDRGSIHFDYADSIALKLAYKAFKNYSTTATTHRYSIGYSGFTNDQLFFVRAAQLLCTTEHETLVKIYEGNPPATEFSVNLPLMNSKDFAYVFDCPCRSPMNPDDKCELW